MLLTVSNILLAAKLALLTGSEELWVTKLDALIKCSSPMYTGNCDRPDTPYPPEAIRSYKRWAFNRTSQKCESFIYNCPESNEERERFGIGNIDSGDYDENSFLTANRFDEELRCSGMCDGLPRCNYFPPLMPELTPKQKRANCLYYATVDDYGGSHCHRWKLFCMWPEECPDPDHETSLYTPLYGCYSEDTTDDLGCPLTAYFCYTQECFDQELCHTSRASQRHLKGFLL